MYLINNLSEIRHRNGEWGELTERSGETKTDKCRHWTGKNIRRSTCSYVMFL